MKNQMQVGDMKLSKAVEDQWIGPPVTRPQILIFMSIASLAAMVTAVSPLIYSAMVLEHRLQSSQIGRIATVEFVMQALSNAVAGAKLDASRLRYKTAVAATLFALANVAAAWVDYPWLIVARVIAGACEGVFVWLLVQIFSRSTLPARLQGFYVAFQGVLGILLSTLYSHAILPPFGSRGGFLVLAALGTLAALGCPALPKHLVPLEGSSSRGVRPTARGVAGLAITFFSFAGTLAIWIYLPVLAVQQRQPARTIDVGVPLALAMEVIGGLSSAMLASRMPVRSTLIFIWMLCVVLAVVWIMNPPSWIFIFNFALLGFLWMFYVPILFSYVVDLDPSRRSLMFLNTCMALGAGAGPSLASLAVVHADVHGAILVGAALFGVTLILILLETIINFNARNSNAEALNCNGRL